MTPFETLLKRGRKDGGREGGRERGRKRESSDSMCCDSRIFFSKGERDQEAGSC